jgi:hypothetical protein
LRTLDYKLIILPDHSRKISKLKIARRLRDALPNLLRRFLYAQLNSEDEDPFNVELTKCPIIRSNVSVYLSARAVFYAPSDLSGNGGMHEEVIRSAPNWYGESERRDTVLVQYGGDDEPMGGMVVARVQCFLSYTHLSVRYPCALVEWFVTRPEPDPVTGMWVVEHETDDSDSELGTVRAMGLIHTDCIVRACHLIPIFGNDYVPISLDYTHSLTLYKSFYVNKYADYHTHESYPT